MFGFEETLIAKAMQDFEAAKLILKRKTKDTYLHSALFHLQYAIELAIRHGLEFHKVEYTPVHNISALLSEVEKAGIDIGLTEAIYKHRDKFIVWKSMPCITDFCVEPERLDTALQEIQCFLQSVSDCCKEK